MTINWDETRPRSGELLSSLGEVWRSFKSNFQSGFSQSFYIASSASTGEPKLSTSTPGFCRAYYGPRADVSFPNRTGTLMVVSNETRLIAFGSASSNVIGSANAVFSWVGMSSSSLGVLPVIDSGYTDWGAPSAAGAYKVSFNTTFSVTPTVHVTASDASASYTYAVDEIGTSSFSLTISCRASIDTQDAAVRWIAISAEPIP